MNTQELDTRLQKALAKGRPAGISRIVTRAGSDSTGDPAVWIWIILEDASAAAGNDRSRRDEIRQWAERAATAAAGGPWVYVAFRTETEQRELETRA